MKFFIDTANLAQIKEANDLGILDGVTTNPTLMAKEGIKGIEAVTNHYKTICELVDGDISAEVVSVDFDSIIEEGKKLQLQAYERLTVYVDRNGLKNLVDRLQQGGESAAMIHSAMIDSLKSEYDYNVSQQVYINPEVWNAITKLKDQNIYVINQLAAGLHPGATGLDLSKRIIEFSMSPNAELSHVVLDAIQFEAKKILK